MDSSSGSAVVKILTLKGNVDLVLSLFHAANNSTLLGQNHEIEGQFLSSISISRLLGELLRHFYQEFDKVACERFELVRAHSFRLTGTQI